MKTTSLLIFLSSFCGLSMAADKMVLPEAPDPVKANEEQKKIIPGQSYSLTFLGIPKMKDIKMNKNYEVDAKGFMKLPIEGRVKVAGLTFRQAEKAIASDYVKRQVFTSPLIKLGLAEKK